MSALGRLGLLLPILSACASQPEGLFLAPERACGTPCSTATCRAPDCLEYGFRAFRAATVREGGFRWSPATGQVEVTWLLDPLVARYDDGLIILTGGGVRERRLAFHFVDDRLVTGDGHQWQRAPVALEAALSQAITPQ